MALTLTVRNLGVEFGPKKILHDISFDVDAGELVSITGRNAAGKTTLLKAIAGLESRTGDVVLEENGKVLPKSAIAYLPQLTQVASRLSVFEMVMLGLGRRLSWRVTPDVFEQVDQTLHAMQISHLADLPVASLSGGQKQLVFMAQAFISRPRVLLLDEPTSALDLRHQLIVMEAARAYAERTGSIALAVVHDLMLADGTVRRYDTPEKVLTPDELSVVYRVEAAVERTSGGRVVVIPEKPLDVDTGHHHHDHAHS